MDPTASITLPDAQWTTFVQGLIAGDDQAYLRFWNEYGQRLNAVARNQFPTGLKRRLAPEDIVQSTCRSFFHRVTTGKLQLSDSESLWRLLCAITLNKTRMKQRFHLAQRRAINQEQTQDLLSPEGSFTINEPTSQDQLPDEAVMFTEQLENIMNLLDDTERSILQLKLEDHTNDEIAARVGRSARTVRRVLTRLQEKLEHLLPNTLRPDGNDSSDNE
jgi:RNA polymerase sigma factor (sigma-70 family)